ncbi:hypothetical protein SA21314_1861 [Staphylococcus aureus subsp. aureus 21314]|uniref:Uncharacterized protein n=1 Tax=Staphylococcus aureus TaxID=1280 RepID=A0A0U1MQZ1_STAAU|nr:hypothetical protein CA347_2204 [Staphylococcus aureus CA-347]AWE55470.1 hypothetical protein CSC51_2504 [Staphylococcus aureus]EHT65742.1 hypothetical protein SACIG290_2749 [Staphylococcus aureus subsp. aureus CIG290]EHT75181.1 hypothetical protein SACIG1524_2585 [Staphylococcus aureus subsp. aureus CIG1524]EZI00979.1 hypothetical protein SA21314_1861 [Staphylococcus aureus subsp. aureus 21314]OMK06376.1 hypothetical protein BOH77_1000 [Staphylococcus aureus M1057]
MNDALLINRMCKGKILTIKIKYFTNKVKLIYNANNAKN